MKEWFVQINSAEMGPFSLPELKQFLAERRISVHTPVRKGRRQGWVAAAHVAELFDQPTPAPPPSSATVMTATTVNKRKSPPPSPPQLRGMPKPNVQPVPTPNPTVTAAHSGLPLGLMIAGGVGVAVVGVLLIGLVSVILLSGQDRAVARNPVPQNAPSEPETNNKPPALEPGTLATETVVAKVEPSVAFFECPTSIGSGFLIRPGIVATNKHVIAGELIDKFKVHFPSAKNPGPYSVELLYKDPDRDLAFLALNANLPPLDLAPTEAFRRGQEVIAIGNPGLGDSEVLQNAVSRGLLSTKINLDGAEFYQLNISINPGNSGGPVLNSAGQVIGVVTAKATREEGVAFCIPIQQVKAALAAQGKFSPQEIAACRSQHRAQVVFKRVNKAAIMYASAMEWYTEVMEKVLSQGGDANQELTAARKELEPKLASNMRSLGDLQREVTKITSDVNVPASTRQQFVELWTNYSELKSYVEQPRGNLSSYKGKHGEFAEEHTRMSERLKLLLGVE